MNRGFYLPVKNEYAVAIDIGTTKIVTLIGRIKKNNVLEVIGYGLAGCKGIKKGIVIDLNDATKSILNSIEAAEKATKMFVDAAYIGVTGKHISIINNSSEININNPNKVVRKQDLERLLSKANRINISSQHEVIHTLIKQFTVDDEKGIVDPVGLATERLGVELLVIYGSSTLIKNTVNSVKNTNIEIEDVILEALASSEAVLTPEEKNSGVVLLDIGGGTTDVAIYKDKKMVFTYCLPVGGDLITNDISIGLNIPFSKAEDIKKKFANVDYNFYESLNNVNMGDIKIDRNKATLNIKLYTIVDSRVKELLQLIKEKIESYGFMYSVPCGLVITGGVSQMKGLKTMANSIFNLPVRIGAPIDTEGPSEVVNDPIYSTSVGLLRYAFQLKKFSSVEQFEEKNASLRSRFRDFISRILKS